MEFFHTPPDHVTTDHLVIDGDEFNHLTHVMRKNVGDSIRVVDGKGTAYDATIMGIAGRSARCAITDSHPLLHESPLDVTLGVALLKNASKFDFVVEKVTELGVNTIVPLHTERTIPEHAKLDRWRKLALAAMKQSGRCVLPAVADPVDLADFLSSSSHTALRLIPHEKAALPLHDALRDRQSKQIIQCIGPEGGFSDDEIALAVQHGFAPVSLGSRRLRTETAAIVAAGLVLAGERGIGFRV